MKAFLLVLLTTVLLSPMVAVVFTKQGSVQQVAYRQADGGRDNETGWQRRNRELSAGCWERLLEMAPQHLEAPVAEFKYNLDRCLTQNGVMI